MASSLASSLAAAHWHSTHRVCCACVFVFCMCRGDEVEHLILRLDSSTKKVQLSLRAAELIEALEPESDGAAAHPDDQSAHFLPEYGRFMIEATPARPYGGFTADLRMVEHNMRIRRTMIEKLLQPQERLITLTVFPLLGQRISKQRHTEAEGDKEERRRGDWLRLARLLIWLVASSVLFDQVLVTSPTAARVPWSLSRAACLTATTLATPSLAHTRGSRRSHETFAPGAVRE